MTSIRTVLAFTALSILLLPSAAFAAKPVCGDGVGQGPEACDGSDLRGASCATLGFDGGTLACTGACTFDTSLCTTAPPVCGDGVAEGTESCDGGDLGGESCTSLGFAGGALSCDGSCNWDTSSCTTGGAVCGDGVVAGYEECDGASDAACPGLCSSHCACPATGPGGLEVHAVDVGQGDAILVVSPDGFVMLVDSGTESRAAVVEAYLATLGIAGLDYTLVTHMDADHVGGMDGVLAAHPEVAACFDHGSSVGTVEYSEYAAAAGSRRIAVSPGQSLDLGPSMLVEVLHADTASSTENLNSVVIKLSYGDTSFLVGGDCEEPCEGMITTGPVQVYKVHHHGSSDSSAASFLEAMDPWTALISVGAGNAFGHPDVDTLQRLADVEATVYRTDLDGDLAVISDGSAYTVNGAPVCSVGQTRTCGTTDIGACSFGTRACVGGMWDATCTGGVDPVPEVCDNGIDDDCDAATDLADPDCSASSADVVIAQVGYDTPGTDADEEFIDLYNRSGLPVPLDGWTLQDNLGSWTIPANTTIQPGEYLSIGSQVAGFEALYGKTPDLCCFPFGLGNTGDRVELHDGLGVVDRVVWEDFEPGWPIAAPTGDSIERADPTVDTDVVGDWSVTSPASPHADPLVSGGCGNGTCELGEDCTTCPSDCGGVTGGKPANRWCCGNGTCEAAGENSLSCSIDCP